MTLGLPERSCSLQVHETQQLHPRVPRELAHVLARPLTSLKDCGGPGISLTTKGRQMWSLPIPIGRSSRQRELGTSPVCVAGKQETTGINWNEMQTRCNKKKFPMRKVWQWSRQPRRLHRLHPGRFQAPTRHSPEQPGLAWGWPCSEPPRIPSSLNYAVIPCWVELDSNSRKLKIQKYNPTVDTNSPNSPDCFRSQSALTCAGSQTSSQPGQQYRSVLTTPLPVQRLEAAAAEKSVRCVQTNCRGWLLL